MSSFAVLEQGESLARRLVARFGPAVDVGREPELLVLGPGARGPGRALVCGTVLLPGSESGLLENIQAKSAVSYGMSGRDTITLSSREERHMWVAVQRELVRLDGTVMERQEFPVYLEQGLDELQVLALTGALLLHGIQPDELCKS